ncbi:MAG: agmatine deiminase family protein [Alphaproteobacteria bacterium]|nr:agmatine deiminase family protein [Alphaproteobacteria bacterium]MBL7100051.1 agmatine deiminase family protein [Alphaproteobacteria bacterium]
MPAEWVPHARTWMCWPVRLETWGGPDGLLRAKQAYARVARAISTFEPVIMAARPEDAAEAKLATAGKVEVFEVPLDDSWARDMGPTFVTGAHGSRAAVQWQFNAWGNKYHPWAEDAQFAMRAAQRADVPVYAAPMVCEGGAIHTDGEGTVITTEQCLLNPNRNPELTQQQVEERLALFTGARRVLWLGDGFSDDETDGHIDNVACFMAPGRVLVGVPASKSHPDFEPVMEVLRRLSSARDAEGRKFEIVELEQPRKIGSDHRGRPLQKSYVNFYLANGGVVMPGFDDPHDEKAREALAHCFPERDILQIDATDIVLGGGGIHCITQQEPA